MNSFGAASVVYFFPVLWYNILKVNFQKGVSNMADEIVYKKVTRKADRLLEGKVIAKHGKQTNQKLKTYVVLHYLLKYPDETMLNRE